MLDTLRSIVQEVNSAPDLDAVLRLIVARVHSSMGTEVCSVYLADSEDGRLRFMATEGLNRAMVGKLSLAPGEGLVGLVALRAEPLNLDDAQHHPRFRYLEEIGEEAYNAFLGVPIIHQRRVLGVLVVQQRLQRRFDASEEAFLVTLSAQLAGIIAHAEATGGMARLGRRRGQRRDARFPGVPGAPGVVHGTAVVLFPSATLEAVPDQKSDDVAQELELFHRALRAARQDIEGLGAQLQDRLNAQERALFDAYLAMLDDRALGEEIRRRIETGQWAQGALRQVIEEHVGHFEAMEDSYLRERGADLRQLGQRVLAHLQAENRPRQRFPKNTIIVGDEITPALLSEVPPEALAGIISRRGSGNSHIAILARALGVPTVMGAVDFPLSAAQGTSVIVDGAEGVAILNPSRALQKHYGALAAEEREFSEGLQSLRDAPCETSDGHRVALWVNIGLTQDLARSLDQGAEGVGLYRTEVPFMSSDRFPTEDEQFALYRASLQAFGARPVTMRTLDIGGDKALSYFPISEDNPFLGWRGIRVTLDHPEIFLIQVRAMLRASVDHEGALRIMLPMVTNLAEVDESLALIGRAYDEVLEELGGARERLKRPDVGVMVEVPAAVYQAPQLAQRVDFLAVGSNDLTQYMLAVDRNNPRVADLYQDLHPAILGALKAVVDAGRQARIPVGICGELAGNPLAAVLLLGMGVDVLSMNSTNLLRVKWVLRAFTFREARRLLKAALAMESADAIERHIREVLAAKQLSRALVRGARPSALPVAP